MRRRVRNGLKRERERETRSVIVTQRPNAHTKHCRNCLIDDAIAFDFQLIFDPIVGLFHEIAFRLHVVIAVVVSSFVDGEHAEFLSHVSIDIFVDTRHPLDAHRQWLIFEYSQWLCRRGNVNATAARGAAAWTSTFSAIKLNYSPFNIN